MSDTRLGERWCPPKDQKDRLLDCVRNTLFGLAVTEAELLVSSGVPLLGAGIQLSWSCTKSDRKDDADSCLGP